MYGQLMSENEILKLQERIKQVKNIIEVVHKMREEISSLLHIAGISMSYRHGSDLSEVERTMVGHLNTFRLDLARLRGE